MEGKELVFVIFREFIAKVVNLEELAGIGSRLLSGFRQGLEFIRRPPINKDSSVIEHILSSNKTNRLLAYVEAGCVNTYEKVENISNLHTSLLGLIDHLSKSKRIVDELETLVQKVTSELLSLNKTEGELEDEVLTDDKEEIESLVFSKPKVTDYAAMMGVIYSMVKRDFDMQEKIISSLTIKSTSGELETYSMMWSLRPYISDEIMHQALRLIPSP